MSTKKKYFCCVSGKEIPTLRVEYLKESGIPEDQWTTVDCSKIKRKKGLYTGEAGTSDLLIVDKLYNDSVRGVFKRAEIEEAAEDSVEPGVVSETPDVVDEKPDVDNFD